MSDANAAPTAEEKSVVRLSSHMATLSFDVKDRVDLLQDIQKQFDGIEAEFFKERAALIAKYEKLYAPYYEKRATIITEGSTEEGKPESTCGVPDFWLIALKTNDIVGIQITERDYPALRYLRDIKSYYIDEPKGFKLEFYFAENPYFTNSVLTKEYHMMGEDLAEPILERAIGTKIDWKPGKDLTVKLMKKKLKKGSKATAPETKLQECETFFNFFNPPQVPENDEELDQDEVEELQDLLEQDYEVGAIIRDKIIPHAVSWYTGEALEGDIDDDDIEEEEEETEEDEDESEEDASEDDQDGAIDKKEEVPLLVKSEGAGEAKDATKLQ